jgi:hypothetical protein
LVQYFLPHVCSYPDPIVHVQQFIRGPSDWDGSNEGEQKSTDKRHHVDAGKELVHRISTGDIKEAEIAVFQGNARGKERKDNA